MADYGEAFRVYVSQDAKKLYDFYVGESKKFLSNADLFHLSASIGIWLGERKEIASKQELLNLYSIDKDGVYEALVSAKFPDAEGAEKLSILQEFAEAGIQYLKDMYDKDHDFDLRPILASIRPAKEEDASPEQRR